VDGQCFVGNTDVRVTVPIVHTGFPMAKLLQHIRKASDIFVAALENEGIEYVFALPGVLGRPRLLGLTY
jgi:hypothetical protein